MDKIDFKQEIPDHRARSGELQVLDVPDLTHALKVHSRNELGRDYVVTPLEGLWWTADMASFGSARDEARWRWTMMIPQWIDAEAFRLVRSQVTRLRPETEERHA